MGILTAEGEWMRNRDIEKQLYRNPRLESLTPKIPTSTFGEFSKRCVIAITYGTIATTYYQTSQLDIAVMATAFSLGYTKFAIRSFDKFLEDYLHP